MSNKNITAKERGLIKGALRRVFSRSELRRAVLAVSAIEYHDPNRPRVKKWSICPICSEKTPTYKMVVDHISPVIPVDKSLEEMSWDTVIDRMWCDKNNLQAICFLCHKIKSKQENKQRRARRK